MNSQLVMSCAVCAREAGADAAFCSRCGSKLFLPEAGRSVPAPRRAPMAQQVPQVHRVQPVPRAEEGLLREERGTASLLTLLSETQCDTPPGGHPSGSQSGAVQSPGSSWRRPDEDSHRSSMRAPLLLALLASVLAALVVGLVVRGLMATPPTVVPSGATPSTSAAPSAGTSGAASSSASSSGQPSGPSSAQAQVTVPATSPDSRDAAGDVVSYAAGQMLDGDPSTAWRMDGNGAGRSLTITFPAPRQISTLGLINGYDKVDSVSGADRYTQERRLTHVTWTVDGHSFAQALTDGDRSVQSVTVGDGAPLTASSVTLHLDATTAPGAAAFDKTAISELSITG